MSRVTTFLNSFFEKWKTNKKNLKNKLVLSVGWGGGCVHVCVCVWGGGGQNTLLDDRFLNMSDCLRTLSALLTSHHIVKNVLKQV